MIILETEKRTNPTCELDQATLRILQSIDGMISFEICEIFSSESSWKAEVHLTKKDLIKIAAALKEVLK